MDHRVAFGRLYASDVVCSGAGEGLHCAGQIATREARLGITASHDLARRRSDRGVEPCPCQARGVGNDGDPTRAPGLEVGQDGGGVVGRRSECYHHIERSRVYLIEGRLDRFADDGSSVDHGDDYRDRWMHRGRTHLNRIGSRPSARW